MSEAVTDLRFFNIDYPDDLAVIKAIYLDGRDVTPRVRCFSGSPEPGVTVQGAAHIIVLDSKGRICYDDGKPLGVTVEGDVMWVANE